MTDLDSTTSEADGSSAATTVEDAPHDDHGGASASRARQAGTEARRPARQATPRPRRPPDPHRRRFTIAALIGAAVAAVPYCWVLWAEWGPFNFLRSVVPDNFYDLQARALLHGRLWVPTHSLGIEGFIHDGRTYTYFGLFPSLLRLPIEAVTHHFDADLTAPSILLAWIVTGVVSALLLWRVRVYLRGSAPLGRAEAVSYGVLIASIQGGSVLMFLAGTTFVYHEDLAWSVAATVTGLFAVLGVLEEPSNRRLGWCFVFVLVANLTRVPTGVGTSLAALLAAAWFFFGRGGEQHRGRWIAVAAVGVVPLLAGVAVNMAKFGIPFGLPMAEQVWTQVNLHRRQFLAANGGNYWSPRFLPSTLLAYLGPFGLRASRVFPYLTLPTSPAAALDHVLLDRQYRTGSLFATSPLLFLLSVLGVVGAFRRRAGSMAKLVRIPMIGATTGAVSILVWGYIAERYLADFMPFVIVACIVGMVELWRRLDGRSRRTRRIWTAVVVVLGVFGLAANVGSAITPTVYFTQAQAVAYVKAQKAFSDVTGDPLRGHIRQGDTMPYWAPSDSLFIAGDCAALYISTGDDNSTVPYQQAEHLTWLPLERSAPLVHAVTVTDRPPLHAHTMVTVMTVGADRLQLQTLGHRRYRFVFVDRSFRTTGTLVETPRGKPVTFQVDVDPYAQRVTVLRHQKTVLDGPMTVSGPVTMLSSSLRTAGSHGELTVVPGGHLRGATDTSLCRSLEALVR